MEGNERGARKMLGKGNKAQRKEGKRRQERRRGKERQERKRTSAGKKG